MTAQEIIRHLGLVPLPMEGGFYRETFRSEWNLSGPALPPGYPGARSGYTAIYYLLTPETSSALHRLRGDEVWHFYLGDPAEQIQLRADGTTRTVRLGQDLTAGEQLQVRVPAGAWQSTRLAAGGRFALMGTTMAPGFDFADYEHGRIEELSGPYPALRCWLASA